MRAPARQRCRTACGADLVVVDRPDAPFAEVRWQVPLVRRDHADAAVALVAGRALLLGPLDGDAAAAQQRVLEEGGVWSTTPAVDRVTLSATVPAERLPWLLGELRDRLESPAPRPEALQDALATERTRLAAAVAHRELGLHRLLARHRWGPEHPYAHAVLEPADLDAVDPAAVLDLLTTRVHPAGSTLLVLGPLGSLGGLDALELLAAPLGGAVGPGGPSDRDPRAPALPADPGPRGVPPQRLPVAPHEPTASLRLWAPAPPRSHPEHLPLHLAGMALGGYFGSRLTQELRERRGDVYGVTTGFEVLASGTTWALSLECPADRIGAVRETVHAALAALGDPGADEQELERAAAYALQGAAVGLASPAALASAGSTVLFAGDDLDLWERQAAQAATTTPDQVAEVARSWWRSDALVEVVADPRDDAGVPAPPQD
ncbi:M16 family metallopeptidase [Nocardioides nanhaiensis]|uniref:Peptidase M16 C-terminal domain-containing protein n=1 Tax=Nocardioides nanhaiensis TaxID=1476871 RepID=A0ABP8VRV1_9ACTN